MPPPPDSARAPEDAFRPDLFILVAISAQTSAQADAAPAPAGSPAPAARRGSAAFDVATSWMPAALASPSERGEESPLERRPRERRPSGGAASAADAAGAAGTAGAAGAAGVRVLLALPLHALTLSRVASAGGGRMVVSVAQPVQSARALSSQLVAHAAPHRSRGLPRAALPAMR